MERTLSIIKPDAFSKHLIGEIITVIESADLKLIAAKMCLLNDAAADEFYKEHRGKHFAGPLMKFMTSNPVMVMVIEGENAISALRKLMGSTDPSVAEAGTIRKRWAQDGRHNIIHGSDSSESAIREINFFFDEKEIFSWTEKTYIL